MAGPYEARQSRAQRHCNDRRTSAASHTHTHSDCKQDALLSARPRRCFINFVCCCFFGGFADIDMRTVCEYVRVWTLLGQCDRPCCICVVPLSSSLVAGGSLPERVHCCALESSIARRSKPHVQWAEHADCCDPTERDTFVARALSISFYEALWRFAPTTKWFSNIYACEWCVTEVIWL